MGLKKNLLRIIDNIEDNVNRNETLKNKELAELLARETGVSLRDFCTVFMFCTNRSLLEYIRSRKMMAAYKYLIEADAPELLNAVAISGLETQPSFNKSFKKQFHMTPTEAIRIGDTSLITERLTWEEIENDKGEGEIIGMPVQTETIFNIPVTQYQTLLKILDLKALYNCSDVECEFAYNFAEKYGYEIEKVFAYFQNFIKYRSADYYEYYIDEEFEDERSYYENGLLQEIEDPQLIFLSFTENMAEDAFDILERARINGIADVTKLHHVALTFLACNDIAWSHGRLAAAYYIANADENYSEENLQQYVEEIGSDVPIEYAFDNILPDGWIEPVFYNSLEEALMDYYGPTDPLDFGDGYYSKSDRIVNGLEPDEPDEDEYDDRDGSDIYDEYDDDDPDEDDEEDEEEKDGYDEDYGDDEYGEYDALRYGFDEYEKYNTYEDYDTYEDKYGDEDSADVEDDEYDGFNIISLYEDDD